MLFLLAVLEAGRGTGSTCLLICEVPNHIALFSDALPALPSLRRVSAGTAAYVAAGKYGKQLLEGGAALEGPQWWQASAGRLSVALT